MSDDRDRQHVRACLAPLGYEVHDIPAESTEEVADQWGHAGDNDRFVIEIKTRIEDEDLAAQLQSAPVGTVVGYQVPLARRNRLSGIVRKAASQIAISQHSHPGIGLLWFRPEPHLGIADAPEQMEATLLGRRHLFAHRDLVS